MKKILLADDDGTFVTLTKNLLEGNDYSVKAALTREKAYSLLEEDSFDIFLLDLNLPNSYIGMEILSHCLEKYAELPVVMISGDASIEGAFTAVRLGAVDFIEKPVNSERLLLTIKNVITQNELKMQLKGARKNAINMIGNSPRMHELYDEIVQISQSDFPVLIKGETGSGKDRVAQAIHNLSKRNDKELIKFNCSAVPLELWESELFGHKKGSYTGAYENKTGYLELADHSSIFMDEIATMPLIIQPKLLRFLESGEIQVVGGKICQIDVRVISASNVDLEEMVKSEQFRADLLYRLNVLQITVPPLRDHKEDIPELVTHFLMADCLQEGIEPKEISRMAMQMLLDHNWKGNIRELRNIIDRSLIYSNGNIITEESIKKAFQEKVEVKKKSLKEAANDFEKEFIINSLVLNDWNVAKTADYIQIERSNLYKKIRHYKIQIQKD